MIKVVIRGYLLLHQFYLLLICICLKMMLLLIVCMWLLLVIISVKLILRKKSLRICFMWKLLIFHHWRIFDFSVNMLRQRLLMTRVCWWMIGRILQMLLSNVFILKWGLMFQDGWLDGRSLKLLVILMILCVKISGIFLLVSSIMLVRKLILMTRMVIILILH